MTLHVGIGTFRPVKCENIEDHQMHFEEYEVTQETADRINRVKRAGGRIISVGTTSTRTLESAAVLKDGRYEVRAGSGSTGIFIYPGYEFKMIDREKILEIYDTAVREKYRFFSYGDAMLLI